MKDISMLQFITRLNKSEIRKLLIPTECVSGWPYVSIKNGKICVSVPYFKTRSAGNGKFYLFPLSHSLTLTWDNGVVVDFTRFSFTKDFKGVDYAKPVGTFKHEAIADMAKEEYAKKREELFNCYDELISCIEQKKEFPHEAQMREALSLLMEPSLLPFYRRLNAKFFDKYCG